MLKKLFVRAGIPAGSMVVAGSAMAAAPTTVTELASSVDFSSVGLAILAIAGVVITLYVTWKGAKFVLRAVKGA